MSADYAAIEPFDEKSGSVNVIIETPKGSRNKFKFEEQKRVFALSGVLPEGSVFPYDFGFIPNTVGDDGDPLDVLLLMDEPTFAGCLVPVRIIGVIEAQQTERDGKTERNDRLIAAATQAHTYAEITQLSDLSKRLLEEIEHFFASYNAIRGKQFKTVGRKGPAQARKLIDEGVRRAAQGG